MSQLLSIVQEKLLEYEVDTSIINTREFRVFSGAVVLVPVTYYVVEGIRFLWKIRCIGKQVDKFPGPPRSTFTGNLSDHPGPNAKSLTWFEEAARKYKTCSRFWFGPFRPVIVCYHPSTIKEILKTAEPKPMSQGGAYSILKPWLGLGLLTSWGNLWARNRRLLTPGFHFDVLKPYIHIYNHGGDKLVEMIEKRRHAGSVEVFSLVSLATLHTVLKCAFSYEEEILDQGEKHPYVLATNEVCYLSVRRMFNPMLYNNLIYSLTKDSRAYKKHVKYVHDVADDVIKKRRKALAEGGEQKKRYLDFLDILLSARDTDGQGLTDREIRQEVDTFLFEGHDTTASAISWSLYALAGHPDVQERARQEVKSVLRETPEGEFQWDDLQRLPYLTQCLKEAMRLHCPVPFVGRELTQELTIEGVTLLPGTFIDVNICTLHHNVHVWGENHHEYQPDRFSPENARRMDPHAFIPFSAGPRNCIGQNFAMGEMKIILAKVLNSFRITIDKSHPIEKVPELVMRPKHGIKLNFTPV